MKYRVKDQYWVKQLKWHLYKRYQKLGRWHTQFAFERSLRALGPGDVVLDCGANRGAFTRRFAATGATVHAFEPDPYSFAELKKNAENNANVICHQAAVGTFDADIALYRAEEFDEDPSLYSLSSSAFSDKANISTTRAVMVRQIDLLQFVRGLSSPIRVTKMDIEGAEVPLLEAIIGSGALPLFGSIFVETHETKIPSLRQRTQQLRSVVERRHSDTIFLDWD